MNREKKLAAAVEKSRDATVRDIVLARANGQSAEEAATIAVEAVKRRGGAQPGAGRPRGKWARSQGRRADATIGFNVSSEFKEEFRRKATEAGMSGVEFFVYLVKNYNAESNDR